MSGGSAYSGNMRKAPQKNQDELSDEEECGDTDEHIIHAAATFNPSGMMSASDSGATTSNTFNQRV